VAQSSGSMTERAEMASKLLSQHPIHCLSCPLPLDDHSHVRQQQAIINDGTRDIGTSPTACLLIRGLDPLTADSDIGNSVLTIPVNGIKEGGLRQARVIKDRKTRASWGYAFLQFTDAQVSLAMHSSAEIPDNTRGESSPQPFLQRSLAPKHIQLDSASLAQMWQFLFPIRTLSSQSTAPPLTRSKMTRGMTSPTGTRTASCQFGRASGSNQKNQKQALWSKSGQISLQTLQMRIQIWLPSYQVWTKTRRFLGLNPKLKHKHKQRVKLGHKL
jgi:hypothetical protein